MTRDELNRLEAEIARAQYRADAARRILIVFLIACAICGMMMCATSCANYEIGPSISVTDSEGHTISATVTIKPLPNDK